MPTRITVSHRGSFKKTEAFFSRGISTKYMAILNKYGQEGVNALSSVTPKDTGQTASKWGYRVEKTSLGFSIVWSNSNIIDGTPIAVILQYGHGTKNGGYVQGRDYINPALQPIFDKILNNVWMEVIA